MNADKAYFKPLFLEVVDYRIEAINQILAKISYTLRLICKVIDRFEIMGWF